MDPNHWQASLTRDTLTYVTSPEEKIIAIYNSEPDTPVAYIKGQCIRWCAAVPRPLQQ